MLSLSEIIRDYGAPVAWIIAAAGWFVSNQQANQREKRKEFRGEIDELTSTIKSCTEKLGHYHKLESRNEAARELELEIKMLLREIDLKSDRLTKRKLNEIGKDQLPECNLALERYYDASTGKFFETNDWPTTDEKLLHFQHVTILGLMLIEAMHGLFLAEFDGRSFSEKAKPNLHSLDS